jgi:hypothetical protein
MPAERIHVNYRHQIDYTVADTNKVGVSTDTTGLREVPTPGGDIAYVRKFGTDYLITDVTDIEDPVDANMTFHVYALDGTLMGSRTGGGAFVDGAALAAAQPCYMEIVAAGGAVVVLAGIDVDTDVDAGGITFVCAAETVQNGDTLRLYLSDTSSTYYDENYRYGGGRHGPVLGNSRLPYFDITTAIAACASANDDGVEVLDSATYDEEFTISLSQFSLYSTAGQTPTITNGFGARATREVLNDGNNANTVYVSKAGNDANPGTYQEPFLTITAAIAGLGAKANVSIMDDGTYVESITMNVIGLSIEPLYGRMPVLRPVGTPAINVTSTPVYLQGMTIDGNFTTGVQGLTAVSRPMHLKNNTIKNFLSRVIFFNGITGLNPKTEIEKNIIESCGSVASELILFIFTNTTDELLFNKNIIRNNTSAGDLVEFDVNAAVAGAYGIKVTNNLIYGNTGSAASIVWADFAAAALFEFENNTVVNNIGNGLTTNGNAVTGFFRDSIIYDNSVRDLWDQSAVQTITESNYLVNTGFTIGAGCITTDPGFCRTTLPYMYGLSVDSGAYRTDTSSDDMGVHFRIIEINHDTIEINNFYIDGQEQSNSAIYIADTADHTGTEIKWCDIYDFQGIAVDLYDDDTDTDAEVMNNRIYQNGNGVKLSYGGNDFKYNVVFNNIIYGLWTDYNGQEIAHNVFYGNDYGVYLSSNSGGIVFIDNIMQQNLSYAIYSINTLVITYCNIIGTTSGVDITDPSNFTENPLFINTNINEENFRLKSTEGGYITDSSCIGTASDDTDVGAWQQSRTVTDDSWLLYDFDFQPAVRWDNIAKGAVQFNNAQGQLDNWARAHKRMFTLDMAAPQVSSAEQRKTWEYWTTLIRKRENAVVDSETIFRLHFLPTTFLDTGTAGTVDAGGPTILDVSKEWVYNEWKGFHVGVIYDSGVGTGTFAAIAKTLTAAPDPVWTNDEWIGYYVYHNGYYYYILDNTNDTLTLSDPLGTLLNEAGENWAIEKYFKIQSNNATTLCLLDPNSELISGSYDWYIDFIECKIQSVNFSYSQPRFLYTRERSKVGYNIVFEEA